MTKPNDNPADPFKKALAEATKVLTRAAGFHAIIIALATLCFLSLLPSPINAQESDETLVDRILSSPAVAQDFSCLALFDAADARAGKPAEGQLGTFFSDADFAGHFGAKINAALHAEDIYSEDKSILQLFSDRLDTLVAHYADAYAGLPQELGFPFDANELEGLSEQSLALDHDIRACLMVVVVDMNAAGQSNE